MRLSLFKDGKIYNTDLPIMVSGSFWIEDKDNNNYKRNLINVEASNGKWVLKSNFDTKIFINGAVVEEAVVELYSFYELQVRGEKTNFMLYACPVYEENVKEYQPTKNMPIYIGNGIDNGINYSCQFIGKKQCALEFKNGSW